MNTLESLVIPDAVLAFTLQIAIGALGVSGLALATARLLRGRSEPLRYGILLTGVVGVLAVPALVGVGRACQDLLPAPAQAPEAEIIRVSPDMLPALLGHHSESDAPPAPPAVTSAQLAGAGLLAIWALGTIIGTSRLLRRLTKQRRALAGTPWRPAFWTDDCQAALARQLGLRRFPRVLVSPAAPMPMVVGVWRPTIVVPSAAPATWQQPQWEAVLLHEAAHIARGDPWAVLAQRLAIVLFWWCPLVYRLAHRLDALREHICDDCALAGSCDRFAYAELLLDSAEHFLRLTAPAASLGLLDSARGGLEARVSRLLAKEKPMMTRLSLPGKLLGAVCLGIACLVTTAGTALSGGQAAPPKKIQIKLIIDGKEIDLSDIQLWQRVEAAQKKQSDARVQAEHALNVLGGEKPLPAGAGVVVKELAFSPDGKLLATGDGKRIVVIEPATGRILAQHDLSKPGAAPGWRFVGQGKPDPRIEELVKQAEAIKPGSGNAIRQALQATPKKGEVPNPALNVKPGTATLRLWSPDSGKAIILLGTHDGKAIHLSVEDLRKLLNNKGVDVRLNVELQKRLDLEKQDKVRAVELYKVAPDKGAANKPAPVPPPADLAALSRQLERLSAELNELRKRLEASKK